MPLTLNKGTSVSRGRVLSFGEERYIDDNIKRAKQDLERGELQQGVNFEPKNREALKQKLDGLMSIKSRHGAVRLSGNERIMAEKEIKLLEAKIAQKWGGRTPTYAEYHQSPKSGGIFFQKMVDNIYRLNGDPEYAEIVRRWINLRRRMEPQDKWFASVLNLFKH